MSFTLAAADLLKFETAVLVLVAAGLLVLAKIVSDLRAEVRSLRSAAGSGIKPAQNPAADDASSQSGEIPADVFAAIVSAVYLTLGDNHQIISVSPSESLAWSREGRRSIFRSHTFR